MDISAVNQVERDGLHRLETFLEQDPGNMSLRTAVFEAALRSAQWDKAKIQLEYGKQNANGSLAWSIKEGDYWLAQKQYAQARDVLQSVDVEALSDNVGDVVLHNIAYAYLCERDLQQASASLEPRMAQMQSMVAPTPSQLDELASLQKLWLRVLHHSGEVERAFAWAKAIHENAALSPRAAAIASLVALDSSDEALAATWARAALEADIKEYEKAEAFVTWATLSLGNQDVRGASEFANRALALNPNEGRAWSVIAFAQLLGGALQEAQTTFAKALESIPGHVGTWHGLGWAQLNAGSHEAALHTFEHALALDRNFAESHGAVAVALINLGRPGPAKEFAEIAQKLDKSSLAGQYANALLNGEVRDAQTLQRLARRLLGAKQGLHGRTMADWLGDGKAPH